MDVTVEILPCLCHQPEQRCRDGMSDVRWLADCSPAALGEALRSVAPELSGYPITVPEPVAAAQVDPLWWSSSAVLGGRFIAKFAWSRPAAIRLAHEVGTLTALTREPKVPGMKLATGSVSPLTWHQVSPDHEAADRSRALSGGNERQRGA